MRDSILWIQASEDHFPGVLGSHACIDYGSYILEVEIDMGDMEARDPAPELSGWKPTLLQIRDSSESSCQDWSASVTDMMWRTTKESRSLSQATQFGQNRESSLYLMIPYATHSFRPNGPGRFTLEPTLPSATYRLYSSVESVPLWEVWLANST